MRHRAEGCTSLRCDRIAANDPFWEQHPVIYAFYPYEEEPGSSVSIVSGYGLDDRAIGVRSPAEAKRIFP
jgi:hypothetical protein